MRVLLATIPSVDEVLLEVLELLDVDLVQGLFESMVFLQHNCQPHMPHTRAEKMSTPLLR